MSVLFFYKRDGGHNVRGRNRQLFKYISVILTNLVLVVLAVIFMLNGLQLEEKVDIELTYGETDHIKGSAQLFYAEKLDDISEENSYIENIQNNKVIFHMHEMDYSKNLIRIDPTNKKEDYTIKKLNVYYNGKHCFSISGKKLLSFMMMFDNVEYEVQNKKLVVHALTDDTRIYFADAFSAKIVNSIMWENMQPYYIMAAFYLFFGIVQILLYPRVRKRKKRWYHKVEMGTAILLMYSGCAMCYGVYYLEKNFGEVPIGQLIYHLHTPLDGTNTSSFTGIIVVLIVMLFGISLAMLAIDRMLGKKKKGGTFLIWNGLLGIIVGAYAVGAACYHFNVIDYLEYIGEDTVLYDEYYVDGRDVQLTFPQQKRNLIYIYLESMETTYADQTSGGAMMENYIPELTEIALDHECFGQEGVLNGAHTLPGATFTMGALVAQTSGVPINENLVSNDSLNANWESENNYLPGVWTIGDILNEEGYNQEFMIGSDGKFAGRSSYFAGHGNYNIFDYYTAIDKGYIDKDYYEWWGYEDEKLFKYAKKEILKLSKEDKPFNVTMLTVDTHFTGGYVCDSCENEYNDQYSNVIACSSRQVSKFLTWLEKQDFYENTTVVLAGDHLTMDSDYITEKEADSFDRKTYVSIVNGAAVNENPDRTRKYTTIDLFPTTLAAMGVQIEGNRLGLGVNLYSTEPTLLEQYGTEYLDVEFLKDSKLYRQKLLYGNE